MAAVTRTASARARMESPRVATARLAKSTMARRAANVCACLCVYAFSDVGKWMYWGLFGVGNESYALQC